MKSNDDQKLTRRNFSLALGVMGIGAPALLSGLSARRVLAEDGGSLAVSRDNLERATAIIAKYPSVDLHSHLGFWETKGLTDVMKGTEYIGDERLEEIIKQTIAGGLMAATVCCTGDTPVINLGAPGNKARDYEGDEAWEEYLRERKILEGFLRTMPLKIATKSDDIEKIHASGKLAVLPSVEGGHMVVNDLSRLETLHKHGVRHFQPIHYVKNALGDSQTDPSAYGGLSPLGKDSIREATRLDMMVDTAHAAYETAKQMADLTGKPIVLSHTMMKYKSPKHGSYLENRPRWISRDYAFLIAETGGVIGTWTVGEPYGVKDAPAFAEAVVKLVDTVGIDHVGWSTDYIDFAMPGWFNSYEKFAIIGGSLLDAGFSDADLVKFIGGNALRVRREVTGA